MKVLVTVDGWVGCSNALDEAVDIGLAVADFDRSGYADLLALGQLGSQHTINVTALFRGGRVGVHVGHAEGVDIRPPGKRDGREVGGDILDRRAVL